MNAAIPAPARQLDFERRTQVLTVVLGAAFVAVFYNVILGLMYEWWHSGDWSHGWVIPFFSLYLVYMRWDRIRRTSIDYPWAGLLVLLAGLAGYQYFLWIFPVTYAQRVLMLVALLGVIIFLCGLPVLRHLWVPWLYLFFAVPIPKGQYFALTDPLRQMAAYVATKLLALFPDLDIEKVGSTISYVYQGAAGQLGVADACSGMRSTITLCALGVAVAYLSERPWWQRLLLVASCVPIAVFANFVRVTITCLLYIFVDPKYARGSYHMVLGLLTLLLAFAIFSGLGWVLNHLMVEDEPQPVDGGSAARHEYA